MFSSEILLILKYYRQIDVRKTKIVLTITCCEALEKNKKVLNFYFDHEQIVFHTKSKIKTRGATRLQSYTSSFIQFAVYDYVDLEFSLITIEQSIYIQIISKRKPKQFVEFPKCPDIQGIPKYPVIKEISKISKIYHHEISLRIWEIQGNP